MANANRTRFPARAATILAAAFLAAGAIVPALSAGQISTKKDLKALAKTRIPKVGAGLFIEEDELVRYGPIRLNAGQAQGIGRIGAFSFSAHCDLVDDAGDGPPLEERGRILVLSHEDNSAIDSDADFDMDLDADEIAEWAEEIADTPDVQEANSEDEDDAHAASPGGTRLSATSNGIFLNQGGFDCTFFGSLLDLP